MIRRDTSRLAVLLQRDADLAAACDKPPPLLAPRPAYEPFNWLAAQRERELADAIALCLSWSVSINPGDGSTRHFYMRGPYREVQIRAHMIFQAAAIVIEPAARAAIEVFDGRLTALSLPQRR